MGCSEDSKEGKYDFFDKILEYIKKADNAKIDSISGVDYSCCNSFSSIMKSKLKTEENAKSICKQFIKLHKSLTHIEEQSNDHNYKKDSSFLNYWVNTVIRENRTYDQYCIHDFTHDMENHCMISLTVYDLSELVYDIKGDDFNKINILYNLYVNYDKLKNGLSTLSEENKSSLLPYSNECNKLYRKAETMHNDQKTTFYEKLTKFTSEYKELYPEFEEKENKFSIYFKRLSDNPNNIITTSVFGSLVGLIPFMGILYKFTPMGQFFRSKNKKFTEEYSNNDENQISIHQERYNIKYHSVAE
ncbi:hypothetical protein PVPAM_060008200 [Plasmodium vivax]|nr:hypothetical protein PVPAM_060008200 [Plasmodium vivax]